VRAVLSSLALAVAIAEPVAAAPGDDVPLREPGASGAVATEGDATVLPRVTPGQARGLYRGAGLPPDRRDAPADGPDGAALRFPVGGPHTPGDGFGGRPGHKGADLLGDCGTPLRAMDDARVRLVDTEASAGRFVVLRADSGRELVYMHLSDVDVAAGQRLRAGERVGSLGRTGNATTCHLHLEVWTAPGWYAGGEPRDPAPSLRAAGRSGEPEAR